MTIQDFIKAHDITETHKRVPNNPNMTDMPAGTRHYEVTLRCGRDYLPDGDAPRMTLYFSKGPALPEGIEVAEVLDCLASDSVGVENARNFEDWAKEYGYDPDSRKVERTYKECVSQAGELEEMLGRDAYLELLWEVERL